MNKVILMGRLTADPDVRYTQGENQMAIANYSLAVDRPYRRDRKEGEQTADFIRCIAFGKAAEHAERYYHKGIKIAVTGRIQTGSYTDREGRKIYTTDVVIESQEFAEGKSASGDSQGSAQSAQTAQSAPEQGGDFINIPDDIEGLPFN